MNSKSKIEISVELDENKIPEKIKWSAEDGNIKDQESKAIFLSVWDYKNKESLRIDLWTKEMPLEEMKVFFHQTLVAMSDTFNRATQAPLVHPWQTADKSLGVTHLLYQVQDNQHKIIMPLDMSQSTFRP